MMTLVPSVDVEQLHKMLQLPAPPLVIDVREKWEFDLCSLPGAKLIPLGNLAAEYPDLPKNRTIVVHCHHGGRSAKAVAFLQQQGYPNAFNLKGGIHAWAQRIDPDMKTYE